ncbi:MAG: hypothetical protein OXH92_16670 [Bryobacterales bacterium]|nr:hypothetical protein [Bryobacterales bacterium]
MPGTDHRLRAAILPSGRIVDRPAWQPRLGADMGENLAQCRFDLPPEFSAFRHHRPGVPFLIAVTSRDSALESADVWSSRSAFVFAYDFDLTVCQAAP